jgi:hypothetical protein
MKAKTKQRQDPPALRRSQELKSQRTKNLTIFLISNFLNNIYNVI